MPDVLFHEMGDEWSKKEDFWLASYSSPWSYISLLHLPHDCRSKPGARNPDMLTVTSLVVSSLRFSWSTRVSQEPDPLPSARTCPEQALEKPRELTLLTLDYVWMPRLHR